METKLTEGKPLGLILRFMIPLLLGNIFQQLYNMCDTVIVGRFVGKDALAAVGATGTIMFMVIGVCGGMATGFTVLTSQKYGAGDKEGVKISVANGIMLSMIVIVCMTILSVSVMNPLLHLMKTPDDIYADSYAYISRICMGLAAIVSYNLLASFLRAIGNSRMPLVFLIISAILNIVLDLLFIIVFHMGVAGAAWATVISQAVSAILCAVYIFRKVEVLRPERSHWHFHRQYVRQQLRIGIPMAVQFGITASGTMIMQSSVNSFGSEAVTGFTAASKVQGLLTQAFMSVGQTMAAYAGQNFGKLKLDRVHRGTIDAVKICAVYSVAVGAAGVLLLPHMMQLFFETGTDIAPFLPWAKPYFYMCVINYLPLAMIFIYRNTLQGCGYGMTAMTLGGMELAARLVTAGLAMVLRQYYLAAAADPAAWLSTGLFSLFLYLRVRRKGFGVSEGKVH